MKQEALHSSLHGRLANSIRDMVLAAKAGERIASVREVAARYKVSVNTARTALLLLQHEGLITLRQGSGIYVNEPPVGTDQHIAILVELDILRPGTSPYFLGIVNRLRHVLEERNMDYRLHIGHAFETEHSCGDPTTRGFFTDVANNHVNGVLAVATQPGEKLGNLLKTQGIPSVGMDNPYGFFDATVCLDYRGMTQLGAETLIKMGCRRLAIIGWGTQQMGDEAYLGDFQNVVKTHGLDVRPQWVKTSLAPNLNGAGWDDFREIWSGTNEKPDGLLIADDMLLPDVDLAIRELKIRVPENLKVVLATSRGVPHRASFPVTRLENDPERFADKMMELLLELVAGRAPTNRTPVEGYQVAKEPEELPIEPAVGGTKAVASAVHM